MREWLQRFLGPGRARRTPFTCYLRENGPIAYELELFGDTPRDRADAMMGAELGWAWKSPSREWTQLTRISLSAFLSDLPSGALVIAVEGDLPTDVTNPLVKEWLRRFNRVQPTPLAAVITVTATQQLLFVQQHATAAVNNLLDAWGLDKKAAVRKAYPRLGAATLETIAERL